METGQAYKFGALLIAFTNIRIWIFVEITWRTDLGAVDIVGIYVLALLIGFETGMLLYGGHDGWCLGVDWSTKSDGTKSRGAAKGVYMYSGSQST
jgi:hypothetical protein